jgi:hypothetical protein
MGLQTAKLGRAHTQDCTNEHMMRRIDKTKVDSGTHAGSHVPVYVFRSISQATAVSSRKAVGKQAGKRRKLRPRLDIRRQNRTKRDCRRDLYSLLKPEEKGLWSKSKYWLLNLKENELST